ncbi:MAG: hypothetical protein IT261_06980 [Saprospiraceae bacterium]|nr:hypothetical protein [Saprospiraceae bacterium]
MPKLIFLHLLFFVSLLSPATAETSTPPGVHFRGKSTTEYSRDTKRTPKILGQKHFGTRWLLKKVGKFGNGARINEHHYGFWGLLFGATSFIFLLIFIYWFFGLFFFLSLACAIVALVFGIKGLKKGRKNKWAAILSLLTTIPVFFVLALYIGLYFLYVLY